MNLFAQEVCLFDNRDVNNRIQVFERGDRMELRFGNSIVQSAYSKRAPDVLLLEYTRALLTCLLLVRDDASMLHIGLGAGTIPAFIHRHFPAVRQRVVELNPEMIDVARRFFDLPASGRLNVVQDDGIHHLRVATDLFDLVVFDAFDANGASQQMTTGTAFSLAQKRLKPGGWLVNNAWGSDAVLLRNMLLDLKERFSEVHSLSVRLNSNVIVFAGSPRQRMSLDALRRRAAALTARMPLDFDPWLRQLEAPGPFRAAAAR